MEKSEIAAADGLTRAHESLLHDLEKLEQIFRAGSTASPLKLSSELVAARTLVCDHFGLEEKYGWKDAVLQREPRLEHAVQGLVEEHRHLVQSLDTLIEETNEAKWLDDAFRAKVRRWIGRVRDHEAREDKLLEEAFVEDLGAGD